MKVACPYCKKEGYNRLLTPLKGVLGRDPRDGSQVVQAVCPVGHRLWVKRLVEKGPCPSCGHKWAETVKAPQPLPDKVNPNTPIHSMAAPDKVKVSQHGQTNFGVQGIVY